MLDAGHPAYSDLLALGLACLPVFFGVLRVTVLAFRYAATQSVARHVGAVDLLIDDN